MLPRNVDELIQRTEILCGMTVGQLAKALNISIPSQPNYAKGFVGQLAEIALGAEAGSKPIQDFINLGIELKTIPVSYECTPIQHTHVCILENNNLCNQTFENSNFFNKIKKVLWLPVEGEKSIPLAARHFGKAFLWLPSESEIAKMRDDWQEIMELITINGITTTNGDYVFLSTCGGNRYNYQYGFYLRKSFTRTIINNFLKTM